jgi:hypothetical protein
LWKGSEEGITNKKRAGITQPDLIQKGQLENGSSGHPNALFSPPYY